MMKNKNLLFWVLLFLFLWIDFAYWCKYQSKIDKCNSALENFTWKNNSKYISVWSSLRDFHEFPCIQDSAEARVFQIAIDENFKDIDKQMDKYLKDLYSSKWFYFWEWKKYDFFDWVNHIFENQKKFLKMYSDACSKSLEEASECTKNLAFENTKDQWSTSVLKALELISWANASWSCYLLAKTKSSIFLDIAYNWLLLNLQQVSRDQHKLYVQWQRESYWKLLEAIRINQSYVERLSSKWTSKTKHTLNSR